jgi:hypothetical protein
MRKMKSKSATKTATVRRTKKEDGEEGYGEAQGLRCSNGPRDWQRC